MRLKAFLCGALLAGGAIAAGFSQVAGAWGARADEQDLADMNADYVMMLTRLRDLAKENLPAVEKAREEAEAGGTGAAVSVDLPGLALEKSRQFEAIIKDSGLKVIRNPSASCPVALAVLGRVMSQERQFSFLDVQTDFDRQGITPGDGSRGGPLTLNGLVGEVEDRCIEDAFDQCLESHSPQPLIYLATQATRTLSMFGVDEGALLQQVAKKMQDCAVYKLHMHSESTEEQQTGTVVHYFLNVTYEAEPRLTLEFPPDTEWSLMTWLSRATIHTKTPDDGDISGNVLGATLVAVNCSGKPTPTCPKLDGAFHFGYASIRIEDLSVRYELTRAVVDVKQSALVEAGKFARPIQFETFILPNMTENRLVLRLAMPVMMVPILFPHHVQDLGWPRLFLESHPELPILGNWEHHGTPVFRTELKGGGEGGFPPVRRFSDNLTLELEHTPQPATNLPPIVDPQRVPLIAPH